MTVLQTRKLSNRTVAALAVERDTVFWDRELTGFGVRVYPTGGKVFVAQARGPDGPDNRHKGRRITVGRHPVLSADEARQRAALIIARVKAGEEPVPLPLPAKYACCLPLCLVGSPRDLAGLFRRRFAWDGGAIREASGRDEVAFVMNDCC